MDSYYTWKKGERTPLNSYFTADEFDCQCAYKDCVEQKISKDLVAKLLKIRIALGVPIFTTSGFRCFKRQADLRSQGLETAVGTSSHELGEAVDVRCKDMAKLKQLCEENFEAVGTARTFIHVDTRSGKIRRWGYLKV